MFSLEPKVDDDGVTFRSVYDGSTHRFTPESAVAIQELLGADIQMVLDVCPPLPSPPDVVELAVERTAAWAARARAAHRRDGQSLFGIVQGGTSEALRAESACRTVDLDFDGYGIGGLSVGETRAEMLPALAAAIAHLPADRPRYLMGVGDPASLVEAVALGVDQFDCVMQTRLGRHGTALTSTRQGCRSRRPATATRTARSTPACACAVCARHSRGYLRHLFAVGEPTASRLLTHAQRGLDAGADGPHAGRHRRRHVRRAAGRRAGGLGLTRVLSVRWTAFGRISRRPGPRPGLIGNGTDARPHHPRRPTTTAAAARRGLIQLGILLLIPLAMYFLMIRPQRRRMREQQSMQSSLEVGDEVITTSGIYGFITGFDDDRIWIEIDDDVQIRVNRGVVQGKVDTGGTAAGDRRRRRRPTPRPIDDHATDDAAGDAAERRRARDTRE